MSSSSAMPSGRRRRATATALVTVSLALAGTALPAGPAAAATVLPPWSSSVALSSGPADVQDAVVTRDGAAVTVWTEATASNAPRTLYAAVRAAGSDSWSTPVPLATQEGTVRLLARADGSVAVLWTDGSTGVQRVAVSLLAAGQTTAWSAPAVLASDGTFDQLDLAEGTGGTLAAAWRGKPTGAAVPEVYAATSGAQGGSWSTPVKVSNLAVYAGANTATAGLDQPQIAVDGRGGLVASYSMGAGGIGGLMTVTRPAGADAWGTPERLVDKPSASATLASTPYGGLVLLWKVDGTFQYATRTDAGADWSLTQTAVAAAGNPEATPEPLIGADGRITLVWNDRASATVGLRTTAFDPNTGAWSAPVKLNTAYFGSSFDASIAPDGSDGSVHVLWKQAAAGNTYTLQEATLVDGAWTAARPVPLYGELSIAGQIAARSATDATAVWDWASNATNRGVEAARTVWPRLKVTQQSVPATAALKGTTSTSQAWLPTWTTNTAVASWTLTVTDPAGRTVRTLTGAPGSATTVAPVWNGRTDTGAFAPNGRLTWTLKAVQYGSGTASTLGTGTVTVTGGAAVFHDFGGHNGTPDGVGDLLALDSAGRLRWFYGISAGLETGKIGAGWSTSTKAVPFGDLNGDRCNDLLVRVGDALRDYRPSCGGATTPATSYKTVSATGWKQYDVLTSPGDLTKDGRPDLIARNTATGAVYLYKGTGSGTLAARVKLYADWKTYKKIVGAGDLNGDGIGDLVAQDTANNLYRYYGKGNGTFGTRVKLAAGWGSSYNALVGTGDLDGNGRTDLLARDTAGRLYRLNGDGKGAFPTRTQISSGFAGYKGLF
ncbi:FG-GAP-like repeat-containing protein [Streptomyces sp. NPDC048281]|uniref:FG-GAP-like repeat-containing protein n=1 Tax=Streptomyces sp. NPDC048281 TaxID=3154715 RepID=UPI00341CAFD4